jgi:hypothetical protein
MKFPMGQRIHFTADDEGAITQLTWGKVSYPFHSGPWKTRLDIAGEDQSMVCAILRSK